MRGQPPLAVGTYGRINVCRASPEGVTPQKWVADCRVCDADGKVRRVERSGRSKTAAEAALRKALMERQSPGAAATGLTQNSRLREAAALWFEARQAEVDGGDLAPNTLALYRSVWKNHVAEQLGELRLREMTVPRCEAWQTATRKSQGPSRTKTARTVLIGILGYAARMGAIPSNPARDLSRIPGAKRERPTAMTRDQIAAWLTALDDEGAAMAALELAQQGGDADEIRAARDRLRDVRKAIRWDLPDLTLFMIATGCRIGEALAVSWDDVDLEAGTVHVQWKLTYVSGQGLLRVPGTKSNEGRLLRVPRWCVDMLMGRRVASMGEDPVFPDSLLGWRDPSNTIRVIRQVRAGAGFEMLTSHRFRKTCLTLLDEAKLTARQIADVAGHADPSMTQRVYMGRGIASEEAAAALDDLF